MVSFILKIYLSYHHAKCKISSIFSFSTASMYIKAIVVTAYIEHGTAENKKKVKHNIEHNTSSALIYKYSK